MSDLIVPNTGVAEKQREFVARPKVKILSRATELNRESIRNNVGGNQFHMIHVAARMTRRIQADRRKDEIDPYVTHIDALKVLQDEPVEISDYLLTVPNDEWSRAYWGKKLNEGWFWYR